MPSEYPWYKAAVNHRLSPCASIIPLHTLGHYFLLELLGTLTVLILHWGGKKRVLQIPNLILLSLK